MVAARTDGSAPHWADIAVLTRRNADIGPLYAELTARDVPVEIVGLGGLLSLPEVMDVTATLRVLEDVTANPDLVRLLTGPRWRIGARDLALLGRRARELAQVDGRIVAEVDVDDVLRDLEGAVADVDPTEMISLLDAVESPGELPYSSAALARFGQLAAELGALRRHTGEPVLDLCRRVVATLGLEVELMATPELDRTNRRDQLGAFFDAVAGYVDVDGDASLAGLLAYLQAELDTGSGLEQAVPSDREAVKLLTVHRAKGLEWEVVFLPALMKGVFPSDRVTDNWLTNPGVLPADLRGDAGSIPQLRETSNAAVQSYKEALKDQQLRAEDRLAYVAATRARRVLIGTGHTWRADQVRPRVRSTYLDAILAEAERQGEVRAEAPPPAASNPLVTAGAPVPWPAPYDPEAWRHRSEAAAAVEAARRRQAETGSYEPPPGAGTELLLDGLETTARWDADLERLLAELAAARAERTVVHLPDTLVGDVAAAAAARPAGAGGRDRPADAGTAVAGGAVRHPVPPVGGALLRARDGDRAARSAAAAGSRRPARLRRRRDHRRGGTARALRRLPRRRVRQPGAVRGRGTRSRCWSTAPWSAVGSTPSTTCDRRRRRPRGRTTSRWSTGRPAERREPIRCSSPSTARPGPRCAGSRRNGWTPCSTWWRATPWSDPRGFPVGPRSLR